MPILTLLIQVLRVSPGNETVSLILLPLLLCKNIGDTDKLQKYCQFIIAVALSTDSNDPAGNYMWSIEWHQYECLLSDVDFQLFHTFLNLIPWKI